ncbi:MAG TPA: hypothetical protein PLK28_04665, partial [Candidatus Rifleibacterium sp.]|nr:hypothetical protein [Candidatus Rifleibacterium sp.]
MRTVLHRITKKLFIKVQSEFSFDDYFASGSLSKAAILGQKPNLQYQNCEGEKTGLLFRKLVSEANRW